MGSLKRKGIEDDSKKKDASSLGRWVSKLLECYFCEKNRDFVFVFQCLGLEEENIKEPLSFFVNWDF